MAILKTSRRLDWFGVATPEDLSVKPRDWRTYRGARRNAARDAKWPARKK